MAAGDGGAVRELRRRGHLLHQRHGHRQQLPHRFDDQWVDTTDWANYANITRPLARRYGIFPKDPSLNFAPWENYRTRAVNAYNAERRKIDVMMYRITDRAHADAMIAAVARGVPVRLITEPQQYRLSEPDVALPGTSIDSTWRASRSSTARTPGLNHQKSVILYDQDGSAARRSERW